MKAPRWLLLFSVMLVTFGVGAHPLDRWHPRNPMPIAMGLNGVAYGDGKFVAVGDFGSVITSTNGSDWDVQAPIDPRHMNAITYAKGRFIAVGNEGAVFWSTDGASWTNVSLSIVHNITAIGFGNPTNATAGLFVAFAGSARTLSSLDGTVWQTNSVTLIGGPSDPFQTIAFGNGRFVATREQRGIIHSDDGIFWRDLGISKPGPIGFGNNQFLIASTLSQTAPFVTSHVSSNGVFWQTPSAGPHFRLPYGICFDGTRFVVVGAGGYTAASSDGTNWTIQVLETDASLRSVASGQGILVAVGSGGVIFSSADGSTWSQRSSGPSRQLLSVTSADDKCVAVGWSGTVVWSSNGWNWTSVTSLTTNRLSAASHARGRYAFAGQSGTIVSGNELASLSLRPSGTDQQLFAIAASDAGTFAAVGEAGTIVSSSNGIDWAVQNSTVTNRLWGIAHGNETFVAVGVSGMIVTSEDGEHWIQRVSGTTRRFNGVSFGNGLFVAVCSAGTGPALVISPNGRDWEPVDYVPSGIGDIAFGNGVFVYSIPTNGAIHFSISTDGRTWERRTVTANYPTINDFAYFNGAFVSVGPSGQIFQSDPVFRVTFDHLTGMGVINGPSSGLFRVQAANGLESPDAWMDLTNLTSSPYIFSDPEPSSRPFRFYRAQFVE